MVQSKAVLYCAEKLYCHKKTYFTTDDIMSGIVPVIDSLFSSAIDVVYSDYTVAAIEADLQIIDDKIIFCGDKITPFVPLC